MSISNEPWNPVQLHSGLRLFQFNLWHQMQSISDITQYHSSTNHNGKRSVYHSLYCVTVCTVIFLSRILCIIIILVMITVSYCEITVCDITVWYCSYQRSIVHMCWCLAQVQVETEAEWGASACVFWATLHRHCYNCQLWPMKEIFSWISVRCSWHGGSIFNHLVGLIKLWNQINFSNHSRKYCVFGPYRWT